MASKLAEKRLQKVHHQTQVFHTKKSFGWLGHLPATEYLNMQKSPPPFIWASPEEKNMLDWHFIIRGPPDSPYDGGEYHGLIWFPSEYPFKPPDVKFFTPSGRFSPGHKICMSMTSYHPSTWNAAWSVSTILTGLLSFMLTDEVTAGGVRTTDAEKKKLAAESHAFNLKSKKFKEVFPDYATAEMTDLPDMGKGPVKKPQLSAPGSTAPSSLTSRVPTPVPPTATAALGSSPLASDTLDTGSKATTPSASPASTDTVGKATGQAVQPERQAGGWFSWRIVVAVVVLAMVSRLGNVIKGA